MRRLLFAFLVLCGAAWSQDQLPAPLQECASNVSTCAFHFNAVSGVAIYLGMHSEGALTTPTDTLTTTWTLIDSHTATGSKSYLWCGVPGSSGADTITGTGSLSFFGQIDAIFTGGAGYGCATDVHTNGATAAGNFTVGPVTTTIYNDLIICYVSSFHSASVQYIKYPGFPVTEGQNGNDGAFMGYLFSGAPGATSCSFGQGDDANGGTIIAAFKPSAAAIVTTSLPSGSLTNTYDYFPQCIGTTATPTWTASGLPSGLSINASTGEITGTPSGGTTTPTINCTDGTHTGTINSVPLTVNSSADTPSLIQAVVTGGTLSSVATGDVIVLTEYCAITMYNPADSISTAYRFIGLSRSDPAGDGVCVFIGTAASSGSSVTFSSIAGNAGTVAQFRNVQSIVDLMPWNNGSGNGLSTGHSVVTMAANSMIWLGVNAGNANITWTAGTGYTIGSGGGGAFPNSFEYGVQATVGTYSPTIQPSSTIGHWSSPDFALRPSTSGVANTNHRRAWVISQ